MDENKFGIDKEHCIIDRNELEEVIKFFEDNPNLVQWIGNGNIHWDINTDKPFDCARREIG